MESDNSKTKMETRSQFSNKEINVRRHGNLVQLILTPSSSTKIRNTLTLQVFKIIGGWTVCTILIQVV